MKILQIILMVLAFIPLPVHAKDTAAATIPATTTAPANSTGGRNNPGAPYEPGGALDSCAQSFLTPKPYNWYGYRNVCSDAIHITFRPKTASPGSRASAMDLAPGQSGTTGYSTSDTPQGLFAGVCRKDFVPVDMQNKMWEAVESASFRCMRVSGASPSSETPPPQKNAGDQLPPTQGAAQGSARAQNQQKADPLKEAGHQARETNTGNGDNAAATAGGKPLIPQPAPNSSETEKIGKGSVVALDCGKNVKGALKVVAEIGDPPNEVIFKNVSSSDIFLVAGAKRVDGYGSDALTLQPGKEHKIVQLKVDRNYDYGEWYAVYSDKAATQPIRRNGEKPSADQVRCLNRMNEVLKSFW